MVLKVNLPQNSYDIIMRRGCIGSCNELLNLNRKVLIVTDNGVPAEYSDTVAKASLSPYVQVIPQGENSKSIENWKMLLNKMIEYGFTRTDCVVAVGGGVVGDLAGFVAASYMRGVDFYNIPTTVLSQVDSSVGGKVAVNLGSVKNIVGAFYQPKRVLIDIDVLKTLPPRQISNGLAEALKMSLTSDKELFEIFRKGQAISRLEKVIADSLKIKIDVVERDEKENSLRRVLNFGHTLGHGIEAQNGFGELYHGECVGLGMIAMCSDEVRPLVVKALKNLNLPTTFKGNMEKIMELVAHDKKCDGKSISVVSVDKPGSFSIDKISFDDWKQLVIQRMKNFLEV